MPEIGEVARVVHYIRKNLVGKTLAKVVAERDENVFGKVGTSAEQFMEDLTGKKVVDARQQGKYFWMVMSSPPHPLMHFGMAGWFKFRNEETFYYKPSKKEDPEWPPKYWKFRVETAEEPKCEAAFVDFRRFARIRLIDCPAEEIRNVSPLVENGPDPAIDKDILTEEWLSGKLKSKRVPVKALLLDQANISGIGNWVGDEIMYDAKIHPEQYSNTLSAAQIKQLHKSIQYVCDFAVENLADSEKFPEHWLFKHRWVKGKKDIPNVLPNGSKFVFLTVGGRTSCVVPSVQKKTGPVAKDVEENADEVRGDGHEEQETAPTRGKGSKPEKEGEDDDGLETKPKKANTSRKRAVKQEKVEGNPENEDDEDTSKPKRAKRSTGIKEEASTLSKAEAPKSTPKSRKRTVKQEDSVESSVSEEKEVKKPATKKQKSNFKSEAKGTDAKPSAQKAKAVAQENSDKMQDDGRGRRRSGRTSAKGV